MSRDYQLFISDIRKCCEKIIAFTAGMDQSQFLADERTYDAVLRNFEIIGEATKHLPENVRLQMPTIDWSDIRKMRNIVTHVYFGVDNQIVWDAIQIDVPELLTCIRNYQIQAGIASE